MDHYKFTLKPLPYAYDALEPYIDTKTMQLHHDRRLRTYVDNLNKALKDYPQYHNSSLEWLIINANWLPQEIRVSVKRNAGGVYNHEFFFDTMAPKSETQMDERLLDKINKTFGSFEGFKTEFKKAALDVFGSGYAWLVLGNYNDLKITQTENQNTPLTLGQCPLINIDVWEHAYYLKHYNKRADYIDDWFNVLNFDMINKRYLKCVGSF